MKGIDNPTNAHDALMDAMSRNDVHVQVYCQVEDFDKDPICREYVTVYDGPVDSFHPRDVLRRLESKGWAYRCNAEKEDGYGYQQWVCPTCLGREGGEQWGTETLTKTMASPQPGKTEGDE